MKSRILITLTVIFTICLFSISIAQVPQLINYQGRLTDDTGEPVADGSHNIYFRIYDQESLGTVLWDEEIAVTTSRGLFNAILGSPTPIPSSIFTADGEYWLSLSIGGEEILPRTRLLAVPFAMVSGYTSNLTEENIHQFWTLVQSMTDVDGDGYNKISAGGTDCDDLNPQINPAADEGPSGPTCSDGLDNDCDGDIDGADSDCSTCDDVDGDGYDTCNPGDPGDTDGNLADCNDGNTGIYPGATEIPGDGVDQDCDGFDDCYQDYDSDTYGSATTLTDNNLNCDDGSTANTASISGDCNDGNASINPGASEVIADAVDQDCDGVDDCYQDFDDDGYGSAIAVTDNDLDCDNSSTPNTTSVTGDCNDGNNSVNPGAVEVPGDNIDQDCDGVDDCYQDLDNDGYGSATTLTDNDLDCDNSSVPNTSSASGDCNDGNNSVNPGAVEIPGDNIDQDCDGADACYQDLDGDGYGSAIIIGDNNLDCDDASTPYTSSVTGDCDDSIAIVNPGVAEVCGDGLDNDCDGDIDSADSDCP